MSMNSATRHAKSKDTTDATRLPQQDPRNKTRRTGIAKLPGCVAHELISSKDFSLVAESRFKTHSLEIARSIFLIADRFVEAGDAMANEV